MRRKLSFLLAYGMLVLFGGLGALLLLWGDKAPRASLAENRMLAGFPELSWDAVKDGSFMSGLEDYLSDAVPERQVFVAGADRLLASLSLETAADKAQEADDPAAGLIDYYRGKRLVLINLQATPYDDRADLVIHDKLGAVLTAVCGES